MSRRCSRLISASLLVLLLAGCANPFRFSAAAGGAGMDEPMTPARMETVFGDEVDAIVGPPGAIQTRVDGISVYLLSDPGNDRMRLMAAIASADKLDRRGFGILLLANFDRTLDTRYAISDGIVYSVYQHPISSLLPDQIRAALSQVVSLAKTFGTSFSAGDVRLETAPTQ